MRARRPSLLTCWLRKPWDTFTGSRSVFRVGLTAPPVCRYKEKMERLKKLKEEKEQLQQR